MTSKLIQALQEFYKENLISVYQYGASLDKASLRLLIILKDISPQVLKPQRFTPPKLSFGVQYTLFSMYEIMASLDVFPMEFLDMKRTRVLLFGPDALKDVVLATAHLRHECEFVLRSTLLKLRSAYLLESQPQKSLIPESISSVMTLLSGLLHLQSIEVPADNGALVDKVSKEFSLSLPTVRAASGSISDYLIELASLVEVIDRI
ncbi:MAG: hypothetical protein EXS67_04275 [Candidatus Margulisbacteria bacterium]|nr:hypothetical protein [Candidatus Margulisiibacteriota bacterium]